MGFSLVLERSPSKTVVLADNYVALSRLTSEPQCAPIPDSSIFFFSLGAILNQYFGGSNLGRQES